MGGKPLNFKLDNPALDMASQYDARGSGKSSKVDFDEADVRKAERENLSVERKLEHDLNVSGQARGAGRQTTGTGTVLVREEVARKEAQAQRDRTDTQILLEQIRVAQQIADAAGARAASAEAGFEAEFGDAWREEIALRVYGDDDIPQRMDGESMEDYRERLETELIEKMIDPETGKIKPEYKDHPSYGRYAEWAQDKWIEQNAERVVKRASEPDATPEEVAADLSTLKTFEAQRQGVQAATTMTSDAGAEVEVTLEAATDDLRENSVSTLNNASDSGFTMAL